MANIIIKGKSNFGKTRSEQAENLQKEGWGQGLTDEQVDKCKFLERKIKEATGAERTRLLQHQIDAVK